jgi:phosphate transport system substrate-binding protein
MKKFIASILLTAVVLFLASPSVGRPGKTELEGTVTLSGAWALYPMALKWAEEFQKLNPKVKLDIQAGGAGKGLADALAGMVDIGMVSRSIYPEEVEKGAFAVPVTKDAVIPTIHEKNPVIADLLKRGVKKEEFIDIWITGKLKTWDALVPGIAAEIHVYTRSDACGAAETWAAYLGKRQEDLKGIGVYGDPGLADAVRRDVLGIGYNNVNFAYDAKTLRPIEGIRILPLDLNGDGKIEPKEDFYATRDDLTRAIAQDIYPSPPARDLYFVTKNKPVKEEVVEFLKWVLSEGQKYVPETGYIPLSSEKLAEGLKRIGKS